MEETSWRGYREEAPAISIQKLRCDRALDSSSVYKWAAHLKEKPLKHDKGGGNEENENIKSRRVEHKQIIRSSNRNCVLIRMPA